MFKTLSQSPMFVKTKDTSLSVFSACNFNKNRQEGAFFLAACLLRLNVTLVRGGQATLTVQQRLLGMFWIVEFCRVQLLGD